MRTISAILVLSLAAAGCGGSSDAEAGTSSTSTSAATTAATTTTTATTIPTSTTTAPANPALNIDPTAPVPTDLAGFRAQPTACGADRPDEPLALGFDSPEDMGLGTDVVRARIVTSCGEIVVELDPSIAPATVNSFVYLAEQGYFDGTVSHRVVPDFVIQAGDPTATGTGGPGYRIPDEPPADDFLYARGVLAMANAGPGTTGSQFFIMSGDAALPPLYSVFGTVVDGLDVLDAINYLPKGVSPRGEPSVPLETLYIEQVVVER